MRGLDVTRWKAIVTVVALVAIVGTGTLSAFPQRNLSSNRSFGVGVLVAALPWPFITYSFSDRWGVSLSTEYESSTLSLSGRLETRLIDNEEIDGLAAVGAIAWAGSTTTVGLLVAAILEFNVNRRLAIRANAEIAYSSTETDSVLRASVVYYFQPTS